MNSPQFLFKSVQRPDLAEVLRGDHRENAISWGPRSLPRLLPKDSLVFWTPESACPFMIVVNDEDREELFNWTVTYHRDLSPLTSWCHVLPYREVDRYLHGVKASASLFGLEAAWAGAAVAEAMVLSQRSYNSISLATCLATNTFALGRNAALHGRRGSIGEVVEIADKARELLKGAPSRSRQFSVATNSILLRLLPDAPPITSATQGLIIKACKRIQESPVQSSVAVFRELGEISPKISQLSSLDEVSAEQRVKMLRDIPNWLEGSVQESERQIIHFVAGYIISRIGGAELDLRLAEGFGHEYPIVLTWAAILGGLGATTYWSDAFGGIGRLVARELSRPFDISEPPVADIAADEFFVLLGSDRGHSRFRTASRQIAAVSVRPGVITQISVSDTDRSGHEASVAPQQKSIDKREDQEHTGLQSLARQLFPTIKKLLVEDGFEPSKEKRGLRRTKNPQLPLK